MISPVKLLIGATSINKIGDESRVLRVIIIPSIFITLTSAAVTFFL